MELSYIIITPARNEEKYIRKTIESVISQTFYPEKWIIVSDQSTDRTDEIVSEYLSQYKFIHLLKAEKADNRNFGSKANAFNAGYENQNNLKYDFIGNIDADISFEPDYFERILKEFEKNAKLGLAGGVIVELINGKYIDQRNSYNSVAGAVQLFRRKCFEDIGGYTPLELGGIDSAAEIKSRMHGWMVRTFFENKVIHHRRVGSGRRNLVTAMINKGIVHYTLGYHPLYHSIVSIYRILDRPYFIKGILIFFGYFWAYFRGYKKLLPKDVVKHLRAEQIDRLGLKKLKNNSIDKKIKE